MGFKERRREWLHKPTFNGAPASWNTRYFQLRLKGFREEHGEFDEFLTEIKKLIRTGNNAFSKT